MKEYQLIHGFLTGQEVRSFEALVQINTNLFKETSGHGNLGPRYHVIDGDQIHARMPEVVSFEQARIRPIVERFAGRSVQPLESTRRSVRVQLYAGKDQGFRWHFDGHSYVAILTLKNRTLSPVVQLFLRYARDVAQSMAKDLNVTRGRPY